MSLGLTFAVRVMALGLMAEVGLNVTATESYTKWMAGSGDWTDAARWSDGLPDPYKHVEVHGDSSVRVPPGAYPIGNLQIGKNSTDHARVEVDGGKMVLLQDP